MSVLVALSTRTSEGIPEALGDLQWLMTTHRTPVMIDRNGISIAPEKSKTHSGENPSGAKFGRNKGSTVDSAELIPIFATNGPPVHCQPPIITNHD